MNTKQLGMRLGVAGLALALGAVGCADAESDDSHEAADDAAVVVTESALSTTIPINECQILVGTGYTFKYIQGHYHYIYTTGSNTAAIACPIPLPNGVGAAILTRMVYIDSNVGAISCHLHSSVGHVSRVMTSEGNIHRIKYKFSDGTTNTLYQTSGAIPISFSGFPLELLCTLGPGAVFSEFNIAY